MLTKQKADELFRKLEPEMSTEQSVIVLGDILGEIIKALTEPKPLQLWNWVKKIKANLTDEFKLGTEGQIIKIDLCYPSLNSIKVHADGQEWYTNPEQWEFIRDGKPHEYLIGKVVRILPWEKQKFERDGKPLYWENEMRNTCRKRGRVTGKDIYEDKIRVDFMDMEWLYLPDQFEVVPDASTEIDSVNELERPPQKVKVGGWMYFTGGQYVIKCREIVEDGYISTNNIHFTHDQIEPVLNLQLQDDPIGEGSWVRHPKFGVGLVFDITDDYAEVSYKTINERVKLSTLTPTAKPDWARRKL
uniref:Uncharacterized protein n=1 Tax=viral metagenome TaxID=1070528 RepID=A0A6M3K060_9ZZZZ